MTGSLPITRRTFAGSLCGVAAAVPLLGCNRQPLLMPSLRPAAPYPPKLDHIVWLARDLDAACGEFQDKTGVAPMYGGRHASGTHNALVALDTACYLEIAAPQPGVTSGHPWVEAALKRPEPHLYAYCMRPETTLEALASRARAASIPVLGPHPGSRTMPDGREIHWRLLIPMVAGSAGTVPFFIDWTDSRHPALDAPKGVSLAGFSVSHPEGSRIEPLLAVVAPGVRFETTTGPSLVAKLKSPGGKVVLTS